MSGRIEAQLGRPSPPLRITARTNAAPMPACAITVPAAEPASPQSKP